MAGRCKPVVAATSSCLGGGMRDSGVLCGQNGGERRTVLGGKKRDGKPDMWKGQALEESSSRRAALESSIHEVLFQIINFANEKKDHIPPIPDRIFNHEISIPSTN
uniref:Autophagy-related protein 101 n=1 Tax=Oryza sativa subsp. japonica TaxID=39947 RepID=Q2QSH8_ORYSJ|nr:hypothetical protein LOC_Os12g24060 [Oryza sativa Japonica Group]